MLLKDVFEQIKFDPLFDPGKLSEDEDGYAVYNYCPCCDRFNAIRPIYLNPRDIWLLHRLREAMASYDPSDLNAYMAVDNTVFAHRGQWVTSTSPHFGTIETKTTLVDRLGLMVGDEKLAAGFWTLTDKGSRFIGNWLKMPRGLYVVNGTDVIVGWTYEEVSASQILRKGEKRKQNRPILDLIQDSVEDHWDTWNDDGIWLGA